MPTKNGYTALKEIDELEKLNQLKKSIKVLLTGNINLQEFDSNIAVDYIMEKPLNQEKLDEILNDHLLT